MSSILEALRKSDNKRQQNQNSGVDQIQFSETDNQPKSRKGFYLLVLFLLLVMSGVWAYQAGYFDQLLSRFKPQETLVDAPKPKSKGSQMPVKKTVDKPSPSNQLTLQPPKPEAIKKQVAKKQKEKADTKLAVVDLQETEVATEKPTVDVKPSSKTGRLVVDGKTVATEQSTSKKVSKKTSRKTRNQREAKQTYLLVHQLPFATRKQLPDLKINVHIFDPVPENRMAVINGESFKVGDSIEDLAIIKDITPEGVVVEVAGTVFMIPK